MEEQNKNGVQPAPAIVDVMPPQPQPAAPVVATPPVANEVHEAPPEPVEPGNNTPQKQQPTTKAPEAVAKQASQKPAKTSSSSVPFMAISLALVVFVSLVGLTFYAYIKSK